LLLPFRQSRSATAVKQVRDIADYAPVDIIDLRHFGAVELRPLLMEEARLWSERMNWDYQSSAEMILRYLDSKILPGYAAVEDGRALGYSFFVYEGSKGVVGDMFTSARAEAGLGERLLNHVAETLQNSPGIHRIEAQLLLHDTGSTTNAFLRRGFRRFPRLFMSLPLGPETSFGTPELKGVVLRPWAEQDFQAAAHVIMQAYSGHVDSEINDQYRSLAGSLRFLNNIVRFPGCGTFDGTSSFTAVHTASRTIVGMLLCSRVRDDVGHVTQVCVAPEFRRHGLARSMMGACLRRLLDRRFTELSLTVTQANRNAVELYRNMGFQTRRVFDAFVWEG
jgi:ribosomal protein S18 acetylase RimI-like enzyme